MLDLVSNTATIAASSLAAHRMPADGIPDLMRTIHDALKSAGSPPVPVNVAPIPAVQIKKSITPDFIICLEDGLPFKMLKGHLRKSFNMSPDEYRAKWGLPRDYPMTAPNHTAKRASIARQIGLGHRVR